MVIFGWVKGMTAKYEVFQPEIQEGRVFSLSHRTFGFDMMVQIGTPVCAFWFGRNPKMNHRKVVGRRTGWCNVLADNHHHIHECWGHQTMAKKAV
jgi:hypothetical protein